MQSVLQQIRSIASRGETGLALLLDPDDCEKDPSLEEKLRSLDESAVDFILLGGSLLVGDGMERSLERIRSASSRPVILFPGSPMQLNDGVDATLLLSLISGRNPELLIGQQVLAAPYLKRAGTEVLSTGYMLVDGGASTTASYMSASTPIPRDKDDIAMATAMAGELLGMSCIYLDAGSGAELAVPSSMIESVSRNIEVPLIVGGGIRSGEGIQAAAKAGADLIVVGSAFEKDPSFLEEMETSSRTL